MVKLILYTILSALYSTTSYGQPSAKMLLTPVTEENGLSDDHVTCVLKDREGLVWIGTEDGLNVIDGSTIKIFKHTSGDSTSVAGNKITALKEDADGDIWIGTLNGLSHYLKNKSLFSNYFFTENSYGGAVDIITGMVIDKENIWVATDGGLINLNIATGRHHILLSGSNRPVGQRKACNKLTGLLMDDAGTLWLCTWDGLWSYQPITNVFKQEISPANDIAYDPLCMSLADAGDKIWVGTWDKGLKLFDKKEGTVTTYLQGETNIRCIASIMIPNCNQMLWLSGISKAFDLGTKSIIHYPDSGLQLNIKNVYLSSDKLIWLCTDNGLYMYNPQRQSFKNIVFKTDITSQGLVFSKEDNQLLIAAEGDAILKSYDTNFNADTDYHNLVFKNGNGNEQTAALSLLIENKQSWWLATADGLVHMNPKANSNKWFVSTKRDSTSLPRNFVNKIFIDSKNILWLFPWRQGVWQMDEATGRCKRLIDGISNIGGTIKKLVIADAIEDNTGNLWLADLDEGIILYDRVNNHFRKPFVAQIGPAPRTFRIYNVAGYFYSVANEVIIKWKDARHCTIIPFPVEMQKYVYDFAPDKQGGWWFATKNGLVYYNEKKQVFKRFTTADGLYSNDLPATMYCNTNGEMIIGANNFISSFLPESILASSSIVPPVIITQFTANGNSFAVTNKKQVDLSYTDNNILIHWALPDYASPFKNQYYCKLKGIDSAWRYVGNKGEVQYARLSPGNYTVQLKAASANGDVAPNIREVRFTIHPPFWKTVWFIIGCVVVLVTLFYLIINKRIKAIKATAAVQQQMSALEMKALRAQMNPHFIFNSLNSIQECIVMNNTAAAYEYLSKFSKLVRRILENSGKLFVPLKEEIELLQWYVQLEQLRFREPVVFSIDIHSGLDVENFLVPAMIIQPYVENALWHGLAHKEGGKKLTVSFVQLQENIQCIIEDNGVGRQAIHKKNNDHKKSMGMMITRERLELFNKQARVETHDLLDKNNNATGTQVIIYLPAE